MSTKQQLFCFKLLFLLLCFNASSVKAGTFATNNQSTSERTLTLNKEESAFHKNMLQPQVVHVSAMPEHIVKSVNSGFAVLFYSERKHLLLQPNGQTNVFLQDANRCESVSRLLFPFHYFW